MWGTKSKWQHDQVFIKFNFLGVFRNPQDEQNPKLQFELNIEQDFIEKNGKTSATNENAGTVYTQWPENRSVKKMRFNFNSTVHLFQISLYAARLGALFLSGLQIFPWSPFERAWISVWICSNFYVLNISQIFLSTRSA